MNNQQIQMTRSEWRRQTDDHISRDYSDRRTADVAEAVGLNYYTVSRRAKRLGVGKSDNFMRTSWAKGSKTQKSRKNLGLTDERRSYLQQHFADTRNRDLAAHLRVDEKTIRRWARQLGLQKTDEFMQQARRRGLESMVRSTGGYLTDERREWRRQRIAEVYPDGDRETLQRLADELGVNRQTVTDLAHQMGISRTPEALRRSLGPGRKYDDDYIARLADYYPTHSNAECAREFGMPPMHVAALAHRFGIGKSPEYVARMAQQRAAARWDKSSNSK